MVQIIKALKYMHSNKVIHRNLELENLLLTERMELKVGDFSSATKLDFEGQRKKTICSSTYYISPEMIDGKNGHSFEVDIWSLGIILYTLLIGKTPFEDKDDKSTIKRIKSNSNSFPSNPIISEAAKDLIKQILISDPSKRPSLSQILTHDFFNQIIPKLLPISTLTGPPSLSDIELLKSNGNNNIENNNIENNNSDNNNSDNNNDSNKISDIPKELEIWVTKWIDFSGKYGLGYKLNNGFFGAFFNDSTKIILNPVTNIFYYIYRHIIDKQEIINSYNIENYPKELQKKVVLLEHFKNIMEPESNQISEQENSIKNKEINDKPFIYIKKWMRAKHSIMFRLSNLSLQTIFIDKTEMILSTQCKIVTYCNKKGERKTYPLSIACQMNDNEIIKRLNYIKAMLEHMLNLNNQKKIIDEIIGNDKNDDNIEKEIQIVFTSNDQLIKDLCISCKTSDNFSDVKNLLFKNYPNLASKQLEFLVNGGPVNINKTIKENKIRDNNHILIVDVNFD